MSQIIMTKADLLDRLNVQKKVAEKYDREQLAEHRKAEKQALADFRQQCREATKWDYETLKKFNPRYGVCGVTINLPSCPISMANRIDQAIRRVEMSITKTWRISERGAHDDLFRIVTWTPEPTTDLCS